MNTQDGFGVYIGRQNPTHAGHETTTNVMIQDRKDQCMSILGGMNEKISRRNLFSYKERVGILKTLWPNLTVQGIPDFPGDDDLWMFALDQIIRMKYNGDMKKVVFYGGCKEDVNYLLERGRTCKIVDRFDENISPKISATEVRAILDKGNTLNDIERTKKALTGKVNPIIQDQLIELFNQKIEIRKSF